MHACTHPHTEAINTADFDLILIAPEELRSWRAGSGRAECPGTVGRTDYMVELKLSGSEPHLGVFG